MDPYNKQYGSGTSSSTGPKGWVRNICQVDWTNIFFVIVLGIATGLIQRASAVQRPVYVGDATIAYPHAEDNSIAFWVALFVPALVLLLTAAVLEFAAFRQHGRRQAWMMLLNVILALLASLAVTGFMTELFKRICGRLRPDFLDRCQPATLPAGSSAVPFGTKPAITCTAPLTSTLKDGHLSFPSGHSSCSMAVGLFSAWYLMWAAHARNGRDSLGPVAACRNGGALCVRMWLRAELLRLAVIMVVLFQLAWPWGVAVSRFRDNRHNISDVVGGLLLGCCFSPLFAARLVWHYNGWLELEQQQQAGVSGLQLQQSNSAVAVLPVAAQAGGSLHSSHNGHNGHVGMVNMHGGSSNGGRAANMGSLHY